MELRNTRTGVRVSVPAELAPLLGGRYVVVDDAPAPTAGKPEPAETPTEEPKTEAPKPAKRGPGRPRKSLN